MWLLLASVSESDFRTYTACAFQDFNKTQPTVTVDVLLSGQRGVSESEVSTGLMSPVSLLLSTL